MRGYQEGGMGGPPLLFLEFVAAGDVICVADVFQLSSGELLLLLRINDENKGYAKLYI